MGKMNREEAIALLNEKIKRENLLKHMLAVEAIMRAMAERLGEPAEKVEKWAMVGLLHDVDFDEVADDMDKHGLRSVEILKEQFGDEIDEEMARAIKAHNYEHTGIKPQSKMDMALIAADAVSGLVVATALIIPSKQLKDVKAESVVKKFKQKDFARNCNREHMLYCERLGLSWPEFAELALRALQNISDELGL